MSQEYASWAYLNDDGVKEIGDIFPEKIIPILSIIHMNFKHPDFEETQTAYILYGKDLTEEQLNKLIKKTAIKFKDDADLEAIRKAILENQMPIRTCLTSGAGTKNVHMFLPDYGFDDPDLDDWGFEDDEDEEDWMDESYGNYR